MVILLDQPDFEQGITAAQDRHLDVHQQDIKLASAIGVHGFTAILNQCQLDIELIEIGLKDQAIGQIVLGCENTHGRSVQRQGRGFDHRGTVAVIPQLDLVAFGQVEAYTERRSCTRLAHDADLAAHPLDQALRNRQAQSRAAKATRGRGVGLYKFVEDPGGLIRTHANTGIADLDCNSIRVVAVRGLAEAYGYAAFPSEFKSV